MFNFLFETKIFGCNDPFIVKGSLVKPVVRRTLDKYVECVFGGGRAGDEHDGDFRNGNGICYYNQMEYQQNCLISSRSLQT